MNELTTQGSSQQQLALNNPNYDPFAEYANESRSIVGSLLKFSKGDWLCGQENDDVPVGTKFVANMFEFYRGWVRWADNKPTDQIMGRVSDGYHPPKRGELGDMEEDDWELDTDNKRRDPWQETAQIVMKGVDDRADELYTFTTASKGGRDCMAALSDAFSKQRRRQKPDAVPVVAINTSYYEHKERGRIKVPEMKIVGWVSRDVFDDMTSEVSETGNPEIVDKETGEVTGGEKAAAAGAAPASDKAAASAAASAPAAKGKTQF